MRLLHRHRRQIPGRHQAAPKQGLLVFMIQLKDFHQQIFNGLKQCFYFLRLDGRPPALPPVPQFHQRGLQFRQQTFPLRIEFTRLIILIH
jgi:hypothetical protein